MGRIMYQPGMTDYTKCEWSRSLDPPLNFGPHRAFGKGEAGHLKFVRRLIAVNTRERSICMMHNWFSLQLM